MQFRRSEYCSSLDTAAAPQSDKQIDDDLLSQHGTFLLSRSRDAAYDNLFWEKRKKSRTP